MENKSLTRAKVTSFVANTTRLSSGLHYGLIRTANILSTAVLQGTGLNVGDAVIVTDLNPAANGLKWTGFLTSQAGNDYTTNNLQSNGKDGRAGDSLDSISVTVIDSSGLPSPTFQGQPPPLRVWVGA
jgi:hypothetical protein